MPNRFPSLEKSIRVVLPKLGIHLEDLEGASCCPAPGVFRSFDENTWLALASRNLALAEATGNNLVTGCNGCYGTFKEALHDVREDPGRLRNVRKILKGIGINYQAKIEAKHVIELLNELGSEGLKPHVSRPLDNIRVGVHYGCHLLKPSKQRPWPKTQKPTFLDELVEATGATSAKYKNKNLCCGAGGGIRGSNVPLADDIAKEKLGNLLAVGVDAIINVCSFCHLQYEQAQIELNKELGEERYNIPVLYYTQLLGLAMGIDPVELGLNMHLVDTSHLLEKVEVQS
ncbi:MAG: CoB--CoM heterodisulfide reductase subunit B [Candidatus Thorarchaeota archaeon]|nr:MAG: CoB--CoM heterodisulfide reductase subunit B [Candidatus Thorarchaeota archaeon]